MLCIYYLYLWGRVKEYFDFEAVRKERNAAEEGQKYKGAKKITGIFGLARSRFGVLIRKLLWLTEVNLVVLLCQVMMKQAS